uniref:Uncharacterized protein n=1 Tax=Balaenoptera musculus TaxID=9771 RepID=A0A8C0I4K9_BALMU
YNSSLMRVSLPGLCLGNEDEKNYEKFSKSLLHALPSSEVEHSSNVTLKCQSDVQNVTFVLGKLQDSGCKQECNSTGQDTKFLLTDLKPKDAGQYFCTYKTVAVEKWEISVRRLLSGILSGCQSIKCTLKTTGL